MTTDIAAELAQEVDRLVLGVNLQVGPRHGAILLAVAEELGLDSLRMLPHLADFWMADGLPIEIASARLPYSAPGAVAARFTELESLGLLEETPGGYRATDRFRPLLAGVIAARSSVVAETWAGHDDVLGEVAGLLESVVASVDGDHPVADAHRRTRPDGPLDVVVFHDIVTVRYVRQHDHVMAWRGSGLTATDIQVVTAMWLGESPETEAPPATPGLVEGGALTPKGRSLRDRIEVETNERNGETLSVLPPSDGRRLVSLLRRLPPHPE